MTSKQQARTRYLPYRRSDISALLQADHGAVAPAEDDDFEVG